MRLFIIVILSIVSFQASAQTIEGTIVEDELFNIPSASYFLSERNVDRAFDTRSDVLDEFCAGYDSSTYVMVLSSRITEDEAQQCLWSGAGKVTEVFDRYRGYVYFNLEAEADAVLNQYRLWTDPSLQVDDYDLQQYLNRDNRLLPDILKTNAPETCTSGNRLACADGSYCCKGTCVPNDEDCD